MDTREIPTRQPRLAYSATAGLAGFTLVELLVVISVIGVLLAMLLPAVQAAREASRRTQCISHLRQLGLAVHNYHDHHNSFPSGAHIHWVARKPSISWRVLVLPYLEENNLYEQIGPLRDGGASDWSATTKRIDVFLCPSAATFADDSALPKGSHYAGVSGPGRNANHLKLEDERCGNIHTDGVFFPGSRTRIAEITDGTSHTLTIGERLYVFRDWMSGATWLGMPLERVCTGGAKNVRYPINASVERFGYYAGDFSAPEEAAKTMLLNDLFFGSEHPGGAHFVFADNSVRFFKESLDFTIYQDIATISGGERRPGTY